MQNITLPDPTLITQQGELQKLARTLSRQPQIAVDTEANSLFAYREQVCLIQFSTAENDYLVDPLALDDLSPLGPVFSNPEIEKIFHAAEYDLIILDRDFKFSFEGLFDTMVSARILGWKSVGLSSILKSHFGVAANKKYQRANWGKRPLPPKMLTYAQLDTHYLIPLRNQLQAELNECGRWELAQEDFRRACQVNSADHQRKPATCWRINGVQDLLPHQIAVLQALCRFRDKKARDLDRPLFKVINDKTLLNIAIECPKSYRDLERVKGVSKKQVRWIGKGLLAAIRRGRRSKPPSPPRRPRPNDQYLDRVDSLRRWRKRKARQLKVESDIVLPKDLLYDLAKENPKTKARFEQVMQNVPWRLERFGDEMFELLRNERRKA